MQIFLKYNLILLSVILHRLKIFTMDYHYDYKLNKEKVNELPKASAATPTGPGNIMNQVGMSSEVMAKLAKETAKEASLKK